jgi:hypothetical protein
MGTEREHVRQTETGLEESRLQGDRKRGRGGGRTNANPPTAVISGTTRRAGGEVLRTYRQGD